MDITERIADVQQRLDNAQKERLRAEGSRDAAQAAAAQAADELKLNFGITTAAQAQDMLDQLRRELEQIVEQITKALDEAGA